MSRWSRRRFLTATAGLAALPATAHAAPKIPRRMLGKTGMEVSILGLGGGSQFLAIKDVDAAVEVVNTAIDGGINYLDCAASYGNGESERRYGRVLETRRKEVYVTSKTELRTRDEALRQIEQSLKNLRTDHIDVMQVHAINPDEDLDRILGKNGVFPALLELKAQKVVRAVGITGHLAATRMKALLERAEGLDTVLCPVNPARDSRHFVPAKDPANPDGHFRDILLPAARAKGLGIIAMKTTAQGTLIGQGPGKADVATLIRFAMSEPGVCVAIVGPGSLENLKKNLQTAQQFAPMDREERAKLLAHVSRAGHRFAYDMPGYRDC
ncbi:MAG TPA: aldo/keto reductase [Armatimonadota bacterium]|nr:aldo/keto reductase [Armatimonadota bacterium]